MQNNNEIIDILGALGEINTNTTEIKNEKNISSVETLSFQNNQFIEAENVKEKKYINNIDSLKENFIEKQTKKINSFLSAGIFGIKYIITSVFIFSILLLTTNYSAYINIAKSYIFEDEIKQESISLLNGAEASNINEQININEQEKKNKTQKLNSNLENLYSKNRLIIPQKKLRKKTKSEIQNDLYEKEIITSNEGKKFSITKLVSNLKNEEINLGINLIPYENRIIIPKIGKSIPLIDIKENKVEGKVKLDNILMKELEFGIVRYPGSAKPGESGNSFIFGHSSNFPWIAGNYNDVFSRLGQLDKGDIVYSYYGQKKYKYKITTKKVIKPDDVSILKRDKDKKELTLMTCWPVGTTLNRLILIGELIEE